jgi:ammonia channel protein AmtB
MHYWVENKFKIDDAVGAVAVHGYAGFYGIIMAGFMLWGYPSSPFEGYATISPWGNFIGAIIMFFVLGFVPAWIVSKILHGMGKLRLPREVEMVGLDINFESQRAIDADEVSQAIREEARAGS